MEMNWEEKWQREQEEKRNEERKRLLAISDIDAESLPIPDRYQRLRYKREVQANEWLAEIRRKNAIASPMEQKTKPRKPVNSSNVIYWRKDMD